ncbi:MAG: rhamnulokinase [Verrucomicrobiales bacterium]|nr:rhamnulokinase [Verrucomicrobiales bacterium]
MGQQVYLGIDLGAESGRVMAGLWNGNTIRLEELHRFSNGGVWLGDSLRWDILRLWAEIQNGLSLAARRFGDSIVSVGIDTWGVDFVLLSKSQELLGLPYHYRDPRTQGIMARTLQQVPRERIFQTTGLQFMEINTLFQLIAFRDKNPELLAAADCFLMMPDFLNWCLSGERVCEFTNATTTQFFDPTARGWAVDLLRDLRLPNSIFPRVVQPGSVLGGIRPSVASRTGLKKVQVVAPATHDTGSAVAAAPTANTGHPTWAYISSGTWSLMGVEVQQAILTSRSLELNMTNEGGVDGTYRLLKNIMGLWLLQQCKRSFERSGTVYSYEHLVSLAAASTPLRSLVDPDHPSFLSPEDMPSALQEFCRRTGQPEPQSEGQLVRCVLESLALKYATTLGALEDLVGRRVEVIHVMGGGSRNALLNQFTADACARPVLAGPVEATVLGNLLVQVQARGELGSLAQLRSVVRQSNELQSFEPQNSESWSAARDRFQTLSQA